MCGGRGRLRLVGALRMFRLRHSAMEALTGVRKNGGYFRLTVGLIRPDDGTPGRVPLRRYGAFRCSWYDVTCFQQLSAFMRPPVMPQFVSLKQTRRANLIRNTVPSNHGICCSGCSSESMADFLSRPMASMVQAVQTKPSILLPART